MYIGRNFNLGMVPGEGRLPATKVMEHLVKKQESFGVNYKTDTIAGTLDGCTTNIKVGKELKKLLQLCLAHGFQLGIVKTVYKPLKKKLYKTITNIQIMVFQGCAPHPAPQKAGLTPPCKSWRDL